MNSVALPWKTGTQLMLLLVVGGIVTMRAYAYARTDAAFWVLSLTAPALAISLRLFQNHVEKFLFAFGASLPFFGNQSFTEQGLAFDYYLCLMTFAMAWMHRPGRVNQDVAWPLWTFVGVCALSMACLPWYAMKNFAYLAYLPSIAAITARSDTPSYLYGLSGVLRLFTLVFFTHCVSTLPKPRRAVNGLALGALAGAAMAVILGLLDYDGILSLASLRRLDPIVNAHGEGRLQSVFGHPGWFAEFVTISAPFVLLLFGRTKRLALLALLFALLVLFEVALILAQARAGWLAWPMTLFLCWAFYYQRRYRLSPRLAMAAAISVPFSLVVSVSLVLLAGSSLSTGDGALSLRLEKRALTLFQAQDRMLQWRDGILVGAESPVSGTGYENYQWNAWILEPIEGTHLRKAVSNTGVMNMLPTPHNLYISLFSEVGILGLGMWLLIMWRGCFTLTQTVRKTGDRDAIAYLGAVLAFHIYGLFQSLEYIAPVWLLIFIPLAYALALPERDSIGEATSFRTITACLACVLLALLLDTWNFQLSRVAQRYGAGSYGPGDRDFVLFGGIDFTRQLGLYQAESWPEGKRWWTGQDALLTTGLTGLVQFDAQVSHPDAMEKPVVVQVSVDGNRQHQYVYRTDGNHQIDVLLQGGGAHVIGIRTSRPFVPSEYSRSGDDRRLGVAISAPRSVAAIGTYQTERLPSGRPFRWTDGDATFEIAPLVNQSTVSFSLWASNPDIDASNPLIVSLRAGGREVRHLTLDSFAAAHLDIDANDLSGNRYLRIVSSRTWVPALHGHSTDTRPLGVAVSMDVW